MDLVEAYETMKEWGLFACPRNKGDWVVGRASYVYSIKITQDHDKDENLAIAPTLPEAVKNYTETHEKERW